MNYLAHLYLSSHSDDALIGALLGDFVKGDDYLGYSQPVSEAIMLHRHIDSFTDAHPVVRRSKGRLNPRFRHTRGLLVDLFYDHFLALHWDQYGNLPLDQFARQAYRSIQSLTGELPPRLDHLLPYMIKDDWLSSYRELENVRKALAGLSRRLSHANHMAEGLAELQANYSELEADFREYLPAVRQYVQLRVGGPSKVWLNGT
ncbi:MAG: DUF479 domain-containing protein [Candidatus Marinimicrobia bacterium]|nr:DUF479 domain-containing protein [Candidatus Neomarinimicrobiota bacterium]